MGSDLWEELAPRWERGRELLWESTREISEWLVDRLDPRPGETILDLAAGTGETGFLAAQRGARLITSDLSTSMIEAAERLAPSFGVDGVDFRRLDADAIDLPDESIDGVLSRFGYVLRGEPPRALGEVRRVLRGGGRFAFAVWGARERNAWMTVPAEVMVERGLLEPQSDAEVRLSQRRNPDAIRAMLGAAGFADVEIEEMPVAYRFANDEELWFFVSELRGPVALAIAKLDEETRAEVRVEIERRAGSELGGVSLNAVAS
ncbi:MAG TPA: methyltransferase domain-containing protein [Gaiellaceae bacterium]